MSPSRARLPVPEREIPGAPASSCEDRGRTRRVLRPAGTAGLERRRAIWRCRRAGWSLAIIAIVAGITASASARAAGVPRTGPFGLTPSPTAAGQPRPYFELTVLPGRSARDTAIISNEGTRTERLKVSTATGVTAANSATAVEGSFGKCARAGCWVTGLPATVTLAPGARKTLAFKVAVPAGTPPAQYLAGITAESAIRPRAVRVGSNGHAAANAIIIDQVTVGVAVTVGTLSRLRTALAISAVTAGSVGSTPRLYIPVHNSGQTFARATGAVSCRTGGRRRSFRVVMETVLPGDGAVLPINAPGLGTGSVPCTVRLHDGAGPAVVWSGVVDVTDPAPTITVRTANGVYSALPDGPVPPWAIVLMVIGALILTLLTLLALRRRHRGRPAHRARNRTHA